VAGTRPSGEHPGAGAGAGAGGAVRACLGLGRARGVGAEGKAGSGLVVSWAGLRRGAGLLGWLGNLGTAVLVGSGLARVGLWESGGGGARWGKL